MTRAEVVLRRTPSLRVRDHAETPCAASWQLVHLTMDDAIPGGSEKRVCVKGMLGADERLYLKPLLLPTKGELEMLFGHAACISLDPKDCDKLDFPARTHPYDLLRWWRRRSTS